MPMRIRPFATLGALLTVPVLRDPALQVPGREQSPERHARGKRHVVPVAVLVELARGEDRGHAADPSAALAAALAQTLEPEKERRVFGEAPALGVATDRLP